MRMHSLTLSVSHVPLDEHILYTRAVLSLVWQGQGRNARPGEAVGQEMLACTMELGSLTVTASAGHTRRGNGHSNSSEQSTHVEHTTCVDDLYTQH